MDDSIEEKHADLAHRFFREYETIGNLVSEHDLLDQMSATMPSPWYDDDRSRWLIFAGQQIREVLFHPENSSELSKADAGTRSAQLLSRLGPGEPPMLFTDAPRHTHLRRPAMTYFRAEELDAREAQIENELRTRLRQIAPGSAADLGMAVVIPAVAVALLSAMRFEAPEGGSDFANVVADVFPINQLFDLECSAADLERGIAAKARLRAFLERQLKTQAAAGVGPGAAWSAAGVPLAAQVASSESIVRAGLVNCSAMMLNAVHILLHTDRHEALLHPTGEIQKQAVERLMRDASPVLDAGRVTTGSVQVGDTVIEAGQTLICVVGAANRDSVQSGLDSPNVMFGGGRHLCLGAGFVRAAMHSLVRVLRADDCRLELTGVPGMHKTPSFRGISELPVRRVTRRVEGENK